MSTIIDDDLFVTHSMGGMIKFQQTGIYPNNLKIASTKYDLVWRIKVNDEIQKGVLKIKGEVVFNYEFSQEGFKVQRVVSGVPDSEWFEINIMTLMID